MSILSQCHLDKNKLIDSLLQTIRMISQTLNIIILKSTGNGQLNYVSPNAKDILGYDSDEMLGQTLSTFLHEKDKQLFLNEIRETKDENIFIIRLRKKDGIFLRSELKINVIDDMKDNHRELLFTIKEIPVNADDQLLNGNRLFSQLAAGLAHEIRNPLTSIKGFIQLMKSDYKMNEQYLEIMENEIDRIDTIANELMIFAKPAEINFKHCDLKVIVESCLALMEGEAAQKHIEIVRKYATEPVFVYCDDRKIKQVIINLIKNAIEAMERPGEITVQISNDKPYGKLTITDQGIGIPKDLIAKLGQPFFTTKTNGNGLGLMMCYKILEEHQGKMIVESELGVGSTFEILIPINEVKE